MPDAWDILPEKERKADTIATFIIFCEGEVTEPIYFKSFEIPGKLKINAIPDQKQGSAHINNAVERCKELDLIESVDGGYQVKEGITEYLWCVYDRDLESEDFTQINPVNDNDFTQSIVAAQHTGLKVAWSNDAFELWVLLHFEDIPVGQRIHRRYIYDRLTVIFKALPNQTPELVAITTNSKFDYKQTMKNRQRFIMHIIPLLRAKRADAISRANTLERAYAANVPFHARNPCTMVHHLIESLINFSWL